MAKRRVKGLEGGLALDWVDALIILFTIYGLVGLEIWIFGDAEDLWITEALLLPAMVVGPLVRRFTLGVPVRHVEESATTLGMFATLAIVFGAIIASLGGLIIYIQATVEPLPLEKIFVGLGLGGVGLLLLLVGGWLDGKRQLEEPPSP